MAEYRMIRHIASDISEESPRFGVALFDGDVCLRAFGDLSPDGKAVENLVTLFNAGDLDPIHLDQAIEDFLYDPR